MTTTPQLTVAVIIGLLLAMLIISNLIGTAFASGSSNLACKQTVRATGIDFIGLGIFRPSDIICNINTPR